MYIPTNLLAFLPFYLRTFILTYLLYLHTTNVPKYLNHLTYIPTYVPTYVPTYLHTFVSTYVPMLSMYYQHTCIPKLSMYMLNYVSTYLSTYLVIDYRDIYVRVAIYLLTYNLHAYLPNSFCIYIPRYLCTHIHSYLRTCIIYVHSLVLFTYLCIV
jgi:hypothetical protein